MFQYSSIRYMNQIHKKISSLVLGIDTRFEFWIYMEYVWYYSEHWIELVVLYA